MCLKRCYTSRRCGPSLEASPVSIAGPRNQAKKKALLVRAFFRLCPYVAHRFGRKSNGEHGVAGLSASRMEIDLNLLFHAEFKAAQPRVAHFHKNRALLPVNA